MDNTERLGLGGALAGHAALFALLSIGIAHRKPPVKLEAAPMDVQLVDAVGLQSAAPAPATEAPQEQVAPEAGPPEEAPAAAPPPPSPAPMPVKPVEKLKPTPAPAPIPAPATAKAKPAPARPDLRLNPSLMKDLSAAARAESKGASAGKGQRTTGSRLGPDFLKGIGSPSAGRATTARAQISGAAMNGLAAAIKRQVQPCYELGALGGTPAMQIVTVLHMRFNKDGSVAGTPQVVDQTGISDANSGYRQQMADLSRRAVLRCAPLKLPAELYAGGWEELEMGFTPGQMR